MINEYKEIDYAETMLKEGFLSNKKMYEINILCKYFYNKGMKPKEVREKVYDFCYKNFESFNENLYGSKIDSVIKSSNGKNIIQIDSVWLSRKELDFISSFKENNQFKRVLFGLFVIKKIRSILNQELYLNTKYSKFSRMCGIYSTSLIYPIVKKLEDYGLVRVCRNSNIEILLDDFDDDGILEVKDFDSIYAYYRNFFNNGKYIHCKICGKIVLATNNRTMYCKECAKKVNIKKTTENKKV